MLGPLPFLLVLLPRARGLGARALAVADGGMRGAHWAQAHIGGGGHAQRGVLGQMVLGRRQLRDGCLARD
jgi:hypothetical protein